LSYNPALILPQGLSNHQELHGVIDAPEYGENAVPSIDKYSTLQRIMHHDMFGAGLLMLCAGIAFTAANIDASFLGQPISAWYHHLWETHLRVGLGSMNVDMSLHHWINDGLMAIFFFVVGLEIKRELVIGELASVRKAALPAFAALGGMVVPAAVYFWLNWGGDGTHGWGIPMATDIAFAAGVLGILGRRIHPNLAVFLVALAIVDDLGAVLVIAVFYTETIQLYPLAMGISLIAVSGGLSLMGVRNAIPYVIIALIVWFAFLKSGIHATVEGVLLALTIPVNATYESPKFIGRIKMLLKKFQEADEFVQARLVNARQQRIIRAMEMECIHVEAPLQRIENKLHPWCAILIMPLFALANAGVHVDFSRGVALMAEPVLLGAVLGLLIGKPLGIFAASWLAVKCRLAALPVGVSWMQIIGLGFLGGIGFTMSLFIAQLAFGGAENAQHLIEAKSGVLLGSVCAAIAGSVILLATTRGMDHSTKDFE